MGAIASQITSLTIVFSTVYLDTDQIKHQSSASLAFVRGIHRRPVNSPHKWPVTRKMFPFDDVIMYPSCGLVASPPDANLGATTVRELMEWMSETRTENILLILFCRYELANKQKQGKFEGFDSSDRLGNVIQIGFILLIFFARMTLELDAWPWKTIGHLLHVMRSFVYYSKAISEFKVELQFGNVQFWSKSVIFLSRVSLKFNGWPWKNIRIPLLGHFKLCASFHSNWRIQTQVTVQKRPIWGKSVGFFVPCDLEIWWMTLKKQ